MTSLSALRFTILLLCLPTFCLCQSTALLTGTVTDPSGGAISGAQVVCRNTQTGMLSSANTNAEGLFRFPDLPVGAYEVDVTKEGFERLMRRGIVLLTGQTLDLNLKLSIGLVSQSVEVTSPIPVLQTASSEVQTSVDSRQMEELPLNGRNTFDLAVLTPGSVNTDAGTVPGQADNTGLAANGLSTINNNWALDGASYKNRSYGSAPSLPNPDALQEFTVQSSNYSADSRGGGASIKMTTRSGTNQFHGTVFEFLRNDVMDARNLFAVAPQDYKHNQYGATAGGPIRRNKLFFFGSFQGTNKRGNPSPVTATVPNGPSRSGDFSKGTPIIVDPTTNQPFAGNIIPQSRLDPIALKLLPYIPLPNSGANILVFSPTGILDDYQYLTKLDYMLSNRDHMMGRYFRDHNTHADSGTLPAFNGSNSWLNQTVAVSETHTFSPTWVMTASYNYLWIDRRDVGVAPFSMQDLGVQVPFASKPVGNIVNVAINGYVSLTSSPGSIMQPTTSEAQVDFSHAVGRHLIRFGSGFEHTVDYTHNLNQNFAGKWGFPTSRTSSTSIKGSGDGFASFMLGLPGTFAQASDDQARFIMTTFDSWIQDDWKVSSRFTVNLGLRWEPALEPRDAAGVTAGFDPGVQSTIAPLAPRSVVFTGDPGIPRSVVPNYWAVFSPRIGFAWNLGGNSKTVVRAAYGMFRRGTDFDGFLRIDNPPFRSTSISISNPVSTLTPYAGYSIPFPYTPPASLAKYQFPANSAMRMLDVNAHPGYTQTWNFTIERQLPGTSAITISYVGNHSLGDMTRYEVNPALFGPGATVANENSRRLYPGLGQLTVISSVNYGHYHSLQAQFTKRAAHGLNLMASYTWSKSMDIDSSGKFGTALADGPRNPFNLSMDYAPSDYDATHQLKIAALYDLPKLRSGPAALRGIVNGWQVNAMVVGHTGFPFICRSGVDNSMTGIGNDNCDQISASSARPAGADPFKQWFNTRAFTTNAIGTFGDAGRNDLRRPGMINTNASLFRHFAITERLQAEVRGEAFNVLNHPNLSLFYSAGSYVALENVTSPTFGQITYAQDPRLMQVALKLRF
jgi:hypothetical protein